MVGLLFCTAIGAFVLQQPLLVADIAYISKGDVWVASSDGMQRRRITFDGLNESPSLSPDGHRAAYVKIVYTTEHDRGGNLWVLDLRSSKATKVFGSQSHFAFMRQGYDCPKTPWSPDGKWVVCSSTTASSLSTGHHDSSCRGDAWIVPTLGGKPKRLIQGAEGPQRGRMPGFVWAPDSRKIVWWNSDVIDDSFHVVDLAGRDRKLGFHTIPAGPSVGQLSPIVAWESADRLVIALDQTWPGTREDAAIYHVSASGRKLSRSKNVYLVLALSHSLKKAVCLIRKGERMETWLTDIKGNCLKLLQERPYAGNDGCARWSGDGKRIALHYWDRPVELFDGEGNRLGVASQVPPKRGISDAIWAHDCRSLWILAALRPEFSRARMDYFPNASVVQGLGSDARVQIPNVREWEFFCR